MRKLFAAAAASVLLAMSPLASADPAPASWDGLTQVQSGIFDAAYLLPGADFQQYSKVMIDPVQAAFQKDWLRNYNDSTDDLAQRISDGDALKMLQSFQSGFQTIFAKAYADAGYQVVTTPGADVLRIQTAILNVSVAAPDAMSPEEITSYAANAGAATLVIEARDSMSGALLARAVDAREAGDSAFMVPRDSVTNTGDFDQLFGQWAQMSVKATNDLRAMPPVTAAN